MNKKKRATSRPRVEVAQSMVGICHMLVCAVATATDREILQVCNTQNPSGTRMGWSEVIRGLKPIVCEKDAARWHFLVSC